MKTVTALALVSILCHQIFAQQKFRIDGFSPDYYGTAYIADTSEVFSPGWIAIYRKNSDKELIKVESEELAISLHDGKALANIAELPYGEHSLILYEDFNFDEKKDFAVQDGQFSCYHGPSYNIYLAKDNGFEFSESFSDLSHSYCGMFQVHHEDSTLTTMTKDGCCWHQFSKFIVENNEPKAVHVASEGIDPPFVTSSERKWNGSEMIETTQRRIFEDEGVNEVFSFTVKKNGKRAVLINLNDRVLYYTFLDTDSTVEFYYPIEYEYKDPSFTLSEDAGLNRLVFKNGNAEYEVYENRSGDGKFGIKVTMNGKVYDNEGLSGSKKGSLGSLTDLDLDNVVMKSKQ